MSSPSSQTGTEYSSPGADTCRVLRRVLTKRFCQLAGPFCGVVPKVICAAGMWRGTKLTVTFNRY